jgi:uncharacterized protein
MRRINRLAGAALFGGVLAFAAAGALAAEVRSPVRDQEHKVNVCTSNWKELQRRNVVMQKRDYSCGAAALATVLRFYWGDPVTEEQVLVSLLKELSNEEVLDRVRNGLAFSDLRRTAVKMGYLSSIGTMSFSKLTEAKVPLIVPLKLREYDHFVVYRGVAEGRVYLADPIRGNVRITVPEFCSQWQKNAVLAVAKPGVELPTCTGLSIRQGEIMLGESTDEFLRKQLPSRVPLTSSYIFSIF